MHAPSCSMLSCAEPHAFLSCTAAASFTLFLLPMMLCCCCYQVAGAFQGKLKGTKPHTIALAAWGLARCGYNAEPWFVREVMGASSPNINSWDLPDIMLLVEVRGMHCCQSWLLVWWFQLLLQLLASPGWSAQPLTGGRLA